MQRLIVGFLAGSLVLGSTADAGQRSWYLGIEGGVEFDGASSPDSGWAALLTVGKGITSQISLEAELGYRSTEDNSFWQVDLSQTSLMLNAVYEAPLSEQVSLAIGVGIGGDQVSVDYLWGGGGSEIEVAAQLKLGVSVAVSEGTELVANYRYLDTLTASAVDDSTLTIGLRFDL